MDTERSSPDRGCSARRGHRTSECGIERRMESCSICQEAYSSERRAAALRNCGHVYHHHCIRHWLLTRTLPPPRHQPNQSQPGHSPSAKCPTCQRNFNNAHMIRLFLDFRDHAPLSQTAVELAKTREELQKTKTELSAAQEEVAAAQKEVAAAREEAGKAVAVAGTFQSQVRKQQQQNELVWKAQREAETRAKTAEGRVKEVRVEAAETRQLLIQSAAELQHARSETKKATGRLSEAESTLQKQTLSLESFRAQACFAARERGAWERERAMEREVGSQRQEQLRRAQMTAEQMTASNRVLQMRLGELEEEKKALEAGLRASHKETVRERERAAVVTAMSCQTGEAKPCAAPKEPAVLPFPPAIFIVIISFLVAFTLSKVFL